MIIPMLTYQLLCSRLILTTVLIASKMFNDTYYTNQFIAQVGGVSLPNINELERFFMSMIEWNLYISTEEFDFYERGLEVFQHPETPTSVMSSPTLSPEQQHVAPQPLV